MARPGHRSLRSHSREWLFCVVTLLALNACGRGEAPVQVNGAVMGTTWNLTYLSSGTSADAAAVHRGVQAELDAVNAALSTYLDDSEISRFNADHGADWIALSADFLTVLEAALQVGRQSGGAYDVTIAPLVDLWGFGPGGPVTSPPAAERIELLLAQVGQRHLELDTGRGAARKLSPVSVDFSSLAKGYAVDRAAAWLLQQGIENFLLEVGGEMRLSGLSARGDAWRVAIEQPLPDRRDPAAVVVLSDLAVATSGDYRNYFEIDGRRYSHTLDPRTGRPVEHDLVSVTVVHPSAMLADAWATALAVLGEGAGRTVARDRGLAVYFIHRTADGFSHSHTPAFEPYLDPDAGQPGPGGS